MEELELEQRITRLVINGHIPLPCTVTVAVKFLGNHDTSSLPQAVLTSPAMGETAGRRSGYPVVKHKPGNEGWGHDAAPVVRRQPPSSPAQRLAGTRMPRATRCVPHPPVPPIAIPFKGVNGEVGVYLPL